MITKTAIERKRWEVMARGRDGKGVRWRHWCPALSNQELILSRSQMNFDTDVPPGCINCGQRPPNQRSIDTARAMIAGGEAMAAILKTLDTPDAAAAVRQWNEAVAFALRR